VGEGKGEANIFQTAGFDQTGAGKTKLGDAALIKEEDANSKEGRGFPGKTLQSGGEKE